MKTAKLLLAVASLLPLVATAEGVRGNGLTYDYVGIGYSLLEVDTTFSGRFHGLAIEGSKLVDENIFLLGTYFDTSTDKVKSAGRYFDIGVDFKQYQLGVGYRHPLQPGIDLFATLAYAHATSHVASQRSATDKAYPVSLGIKSRLNADTEGSAEGIIADGNFAYLLNLHYKLSDLYSVGGAYRYDKNTNLYALTVRFMY